MVQRSTRSILSCILFATTFSLLSSLAFGSDSLTSQCTPGEACIEHEVEEAELGELDTLRVELLQRRNAIAGSALQEQRPETDLTATAENGSSELQESVAGNCYDYTCSNEYVKGQRCQCNSGCRHYHNCCSDYLPRCVWHTLPQSPDQPATAPPPSPSSPASAPGSSELPYGHPSSSVTYPEYPGFKLWLVEEFDSPLDLDHDKIWTWSDGGLPEGQVRFVKDAIKFKDGKMMIEASYSHGDQGQSCSKAEVGSVAHKKLVSGEIRTKYNMFRYGRYEVRMKAPSVQQGNAKVNGNYISTMFVFRQPKYKHWREIDLEVTGDSSNIFTTNVLSADNAAGWSPGIQKSEHYHIPGNSRTDFHTFAFEWLPNSIKWFVDGKQVREYRGGAVHIPDMSTKIMMNLWIFNTAYGFGGSEGHNNQYPMHNEYDWFRYYKWEGDKDYPCSDASDSCLTADDKWLAGNNPCDGIDNTGYVHGLRACQAHETHCS